MSSQEQPVEEVPTPVEGSQPAEKPIQERLEYRGYVDIPDACPAEQEARGSCLNPDHFHAWCRLPNGFQRRDIVKKAQAAQGRTKRRLREEGSDDFEAIESDMDDLRVNGVREEIVDGLLGRDALRDLQAAVDEVKAEESGKYTLIDEDITRLRELSVLPEDERENDELEELKRHTSAYWEAVDAEVKRRQAPRRSALMEKDWDDLIEDARRDRVESRAADEFVHTFGTWRMFLCTFYAGNHTQRRFASVESMQADTEPEIVTGITEFFDRLERGLPKDSAQTRSG